MNKLCFTAFVAFWSSVATIVSLSLLAGPQSSAGPADAGVTTPPVGFTLEAVARHNTAGDCWMTIEGKVYDLTSYLPKHPTPAAVITPYCGTEATKGMRTKGYGNDHSQFAWKSLSNYQVGDLQ